MNLVDYAIDELKAIGMYGTGDEMNQMMSNNIIELLEVFSKQGHSGFSAPYCINMFKQLANYKPLSPLTGNDDEWNCVSEQFGYTVYQNKRHSSVFKEGVYAYDIDGKVFWEWYRDSDGTISKTYYTNEECFTPITFPYTVPEKAIVEYRWLPSDENSEPQNEAGFI